MSRVAVVTGSNKGIGEAIVKKLCQEHSDWIIYLTARNESLGRATVKTLETEGLSPKFHQLDICDQGSIDKLKEYLVSQHGGLDVLVNNAGIAYKGSSTAPFAEQAEVSVKTNFTATLNICNALFPILRPHARVVNVSSGSSRYVLGKLSKELKTTFTSLGSMTVDNLVKLMETFVNLSKAGEHADKGWPSSAYGTSKLGVTCLSMLQQRAFLQDSREDIIVNACCPGYVDTDMTSHKGHLTPAEGADTPVFLTTLPSDTDIKGKFVEKRQVTPWNMDTK